MWRSSAFLLATIILAITLADTVYRDIDSFENQLAEDMDYLLHSENVIGDEYEYGIRGETEAAEVDLGQTIQYTLGTRRAGDRIVATTTKKQKWAKPQNVTVTLQYPTSGYGATLTYLFVTVNQTSALGRAYVISGGVGQRFVQLAVESDLTYSMDYSVFFYGV